MGLIYILIDRTDRAYHLPYVGIYTNKELAKKALNTLKEKTSEHARRLIYIETVEANSTHLQARHFLP